MNDLLNDLFNPQVKAETEQSNVTEFKPSAKKGKGGVYTAIIRFIPNPKDPNGKSIIQKYTTTILNPLTNAWRTIDNPSSVGQPDPLVDTFFKLRNSQNAQQKESSKQFSRRKSYASLVQVIKCDCEEGLDNKILVWRYGQKVHDKIVAEMNPPLGQPVNPFDPIHGRLFQVKVVEVSGFNNYDQSMFFDAPQQNGMRVIHNGAPIIVDEKFASTEQGRSFVLNYLNENCPDMEVYEYHPWDEQTTKFVDDMIQLYTTGVMPQTVPQATASLSDMLTKQNNSVQTPVTQSAPQTTDLASLGLQLGVSVPDSTPAVGQPQGTGSLNVGIDQSELDAILSSNSGVSQNRGSEDSGIGALGSLDDILNGNMM